MVAGDFLPAEGISKDEVPQTAEMKETNGVWEYTTKPLASELYSYTFIVDGLRILDPNNVYINRDVASNLLYYSGFRAYHAFKSGGFEFCDCRRYRQG